MTYYVFIENGRINGTGQCKCLNAEISNIEVEDEVYNNIEKYIWDGTNLVLDPEYEDKQAQKERERIALLSLARGDVFRGLLQAKGITKDQIKTMIDVMPANTPEEIIAKEMTKIDFEDALNFYRGNALIDTLGLALGITSEQLDKFFEYNDYTYLLPIVEPEEPIEPEVVEPTDEPSEVEPEVVPEEPTETIE